MGYYTELEAPEEARTHLVRSIHLEWLQDIRVNNIDNNGPYSTWRFGYLNKIMHTKHLAQCLAHSKHLIIVKIIIHFYYASSFI